MTASTTTIIAEEARVLNDVEQFICAADQPDPAPEILKRKSQAIASCRARRRDAGDPLDHLSDWEVWEQIAGPARALLRYSSH